MRIIKISLLILVVAILSATVFAEKENKIVSVESNSINISAPETTYCQGTTCVIEFTITNKNDVDKNLIPSSYFYSNQIIPLKLEKYGDVTETRIVNAPYQCNCVEDEVNSSIVCQTCDNITTYDYTYKGYYEMPSEKDSKEIKNKDFTKIRKNEVEKFRATIYQPLGQKTKYDIKATDDTNTETTLDPWADSNNYYINLTSYNSLSNGIISYYSFNTGQDLIDIATSRYNITKTGSPSYGSGKLGNAYTIYGTGGASTPTNNLEVFNLNFNGVENFTISAWIKFPSTLNSGYGLFTIGSTGSVNKYGIYASSTSNVNVQTNSQDSTSYIVNYNPIKNDWTHVVYIYEKYNSSIFRVSVYENNILKGSYNATFHTMLTPTKMCFIGSAANDRCQYGMVNGYSIDEFGMWNRSLIPIEREILYNNGSGLSFPFNFNLNINNLNDNLTINSNYTDIRIDYDSNIINSINDTALGNNLVSGQCYPLLQNALNWSISANLNYSEDVSRAVNYTFTFCFCINKSFGLEAILDGVTSSEIGNAYTSYSDKTVYIRLANGSQYTGRFDKFIVSGNKRYAFNYDPNISSGFTMYNITPVFYVWQNINMSYFDIKNSVQSLIDSTN